MRSSDGNDWVPVFGAPVCLLALIFTGCAGMEIPKALVLTPKKVKVGETRPVMFKKLVIKIPRGERIGAVQAGVICSDRGDLTWRGGSVVAEEEFGEVLDNELTSAGYTAVGDPEALFEDISAWKAEYLIAGIAKNLKANICYPYGHLGNLISAKGEAFIEVDWQIYSRRSRAVKLKVTTQGSASLSRATAAGDKEVIIQAFRLASRNLLANDKFYELVALRLPQDQNQQKEMKTIEVTFLSPPDGTSDKRSESLIADSRMAVVTVFAGSGHGSGFLISRDGYLLTNQHVVGDARFIKVKFVTGREVSGEVIRTDRARDVALVKLEYDIYRSLPVGNSDSVPVGSEVFCISTPFSEELGQSVTKGIVSGYREIYGQRVIQSDVNISPGSSGGPLLNKQGAVVGIAVMGFQAGPGVGTGINYFIPIEEVIEVLGIKQGKPS